MTQMREHWWQRFESFLATDPQDVGCDEAMKVLHIYAELLASGEDAAAAYPGVAAHLAACGPCEEDTQGLLLAIALHADAAHTERTNTRDTPSRSTV